MCLLHAIWSFEEKKKVTLYIGIINSFYKNLVFITRYTKVYFEILKIDYFLFGTISVLYYYENDFIIEV